MSLKAPGFLAILLLGTLDVVVHAQVVTRTPEIRSQFGYSHVFGDRSFGQGTIGASIRLPVAARASLEPEITYTWSRHDSSVNGLAKVVFDLTGGGDAVPYFAAGFGAHASGSPSDVGMAALAAFGSRIRLGRRFLVSPEVRVAFPFLEIAMPGVVVGFGYTF
jgi:hypothetical protein